MPMRGPSVAGHPLRGLVYVRCVQVEARFAKELHLDDVSS
jgi:hypothetical protein